MKTKIKIIVLLLLLVIITKAQNYEIWNVNVNTATSRDTIIQYPNGNTNYVNLIGYNWSCTFNFSAVNKHLKLNIGGSNISIGKRFNKSLYDSYSKTTTVDSTDVYGFTSVLHDTLVIWSYKTDFTKVTKNTGVSTTTYLKSLSGTNFPFKYPAIEIIDSASTTGTLPCNCIFYK
jgi:hypothetical protein